MSVKNQGRYGSAHENAERLAKSHPKFFIVSLIQKSLPKVEEKELWDIDVKRFFFWLWRDYISYRLVGFFTTKVDSGKKAAMEVTVHRD